MLKWFSAKIKNRLKITEREAIHLMAQQKSLVCGKAKYNWKSGKAFQNTFTCLDITVLHSKREFVTYYAMKE